MLKSEVLFIPAESNALPLEDVWRWYGNVAQEMSLVDLSVEERQQFQGYYEEAGLLKDWRRPFFKHHYAVPLHIALGEIFKTGKKPRILDLGCGTGTQSLLFALLGAEVIGVDMDVQGLRILSKRREAYERLSGRELKIDVHCGDVFELDFEKLGPFDAIYSLFAFNMMQPTDQLINRLVPHMSPDGVVVVQDGTREHFYNRVFRPRFASKRGLRQNFERLGFGEVQQIGGYALPPPVWAFLPDTLLAPIDRALTSFDLLAVSHLHVARKTVC